MDLTSRAETARAIGLSEMTWSLLVCEGIAPEAVAWSDGEPRWLLDEVVAWDRRAEDRCG